MTGAKTMSVSPMKAARTAADPEVAKQAHALAALATAPRLSNHQAGVADEADHIDDGPADAGMCGRHCTHDTGDQP